MEKLLQENAITRAQSNDDAFCATVYPKIRQSWSSSKSNLMKRVTRTRNRNAPLDKFAATVFGVSVDSVRESHRQRGALFRHFRRRYDKAEAEKDLKRADWLLQGEDPKKNPFDEKRPSFWTIFNQELGKFRRQPDKGVCAIRDIENKDIDTYKYGHEEDDGAEEHSSTGEHDESDHGSQPYEGYNSALGF
ncbi:hypothetical protein DFS34DRAFT_638250 [Phlyctochytrium arcticum]|nr:hypothetical protein DFS34DRAFT_638250 [Phlyctochytrium arcticum]